MKKPIPPPCCYNSMSCLRVDCSLRGSSHKHGCDFNAANGRWRYAAPLSATVEYVTVRCYNLVVKLNSRLMMERSYDYI